MNYLLLLIANVRDPTQTDSGRQEGNILVPVIEKFWGNSNFQLPKEFISNQSYPSPFHLALWAKMALSSITFMHNNLAPQ